MFGLFLNVFFFWMETEMLHLEKEDNPRLGVGEPWDGVWVKEQNKQVFLIGDPTYCHTEIMIGYAIGPGNHVMGEQQN